MKLSWPVSSVPPAEAVRASKPPLLYWAVAVVARSAREMAGRARRAMRQARGAGSCMCFVRREENRSCKERRRQEPTPSASSAAASSPMLRACAEPPLRSIPPLADVHPPRVADDDAEAVGLDGLDL